MHRAMYEARPEAQAIVHLHSTYVTAYSCLAEDGGIPPLTPYFVMRLGRDVPTVPYHRPGSAEMLDDILGAGRRSPGVVLANHGSIVAGATLESAVNAAEELEVSALDTDRPSAITVPRPTETRYGVSCATPVPKLDPVCSTLERL